MAHLYGAAGQYARTKAIRMFDRMMLAAFVLQALFGAMIGFVLGRMISTWWALLAFAAIGVTAWGFIKWFDKEVDSWRRERIKYLRGGQAEAFVGWLLKNELNDSWHVFNSLKLEQDSDIDHVAVGPDGVFCISTKSYRGFYEKQADKSWLRNGKPAPEVQAAAAQTMRIVDRFRVLMGDDIPFVQPVLAVPLAWVEGDALSDRVWVLHQENLTDYLAPDPSRKRLKPAEVQRVVEVLEMLKRSAAGVYQRPSRAEG